MELIDLRSDTVTRPTAAMRDAMMNAPLGDDVLGDDPTVKQLEERFAALLGKDAAIFVPSGTMANQTALRAHTEPGDEIIAHEGSHIIHYEGGAPAALSGCMVRVIPGPRGQFGPQHVEAALRPDNDHFPRPRVVSIENTHNRGGGAVWKLEDMRAVTDAARKYRLRVHLDGARLWNAGVASGTSMREYAALADTVSCCFSKGLGAPVGSALAGDVETIRRARRFRKMFGGAMRQSGLLAAACIYAMDHHVQRLAEDHANARHLGQGLSAVSGLLLDPQHAAAGIESNIVLFCVKDDVGFDAAALCERLRARNVLMLPTGPRRLRAVTHLDVTRAQIDRAVALIAEAMRSPR